jgi:hypothetical protein
MIKNRAVIVQLFSGGRKGRVGQGARGGAEDKSWEEWVSTGRYTRGETREGSMQRRDSGTYRVSRNM